MTILNYKPARETPIADVEIGDQVQTPWGFRVVHDIREEGDTFEFFFWDDEPIIRRAGTSVAAMKRWSQ